MFKKLLLVTALTSPVYLAEIAHADPITVGTAAISAGIAYASGATILGLSVGWTAAVIFAGSIALAYASQALTPKPKLPMLSNGLSDRTKQVQQPITARDIVYGETRKSGPLLFVDVNVGKSVNNTPADRLHMIIALASHEIEAIEEIYLDDYPIFPDEINPDGSTTDERFKGRIIIKKYLGTQDQAAVPEILEAFPEVWTDDHQLKGIAYLYVRIANRMAHFSSIPQISAWVKGKKVVDFRDSAGPRIWSPNPALCVFDYLTSTPDEMGVGFDAENETKIETFIVGANHSDQFVDTQDVTHEVLGVNVEGDYLEVDGDICRFQTGDRVNVESTGNIPGGLEGDLYIIVKRRVVRTVGAEANVSKVQIRFAGSYDDALNGDYVSITDSGSDTITVVKNGEPRYTCCGVISSDRRPYDNVGDILSCMHGRLSYVGGKWELLTSIYNLTEITFDENDIRQGTTMKIQTRHSRRERFNAVRGLYSSPLFKHVATDYPPVTNAFYEEEDNNNRIWKDFDLPFTPRPHTAQRLAKIELEKHRQQITLQISTNLAGMECKVGDVVLISNERFGWVEKEFEVSEWKMVSEEIDGKPFLGCDILLRETDISVYDWNSGEETSIDPAPNTQLLNPFDIDNPTNLTVTSGDEYLDIRLDGTVFSRMFVSWTSPDNPYVTTGGRIEVQYKQSSESAWRNHISVEGDETSTYILDVKDGTLYDVRIRSVNYIGTRLPEWVTVNNHLVIGKTAPPSSPSTFNVARLADGTRRFTWTHSSIPADVRVGGGYVIRYRLGTGWAWEDMIPLHTGVLVNSPYETNDLVAGTYTFAIKSVDSSGNESLSAILVEATLGDPRLRSVIDSRNEFSEDWDGTKVDCFVNSQGHLEAEGDEGWEDLPATWADLDDEWRDIVANKSPISYTTPVFDLGQNISFTPLSTIDAEGSVTVEMRTGTDLDGAPTGSFVPIGPVVDMRYLEIKISVSGVAPYIFGMVTLLDAETQVEDYEDIDTSGPSNAIPEFERIDTGHFKLATRGNTANITKATITAFQNAGSGWTWELISKSTTITGDTEPAAEFKIYKDGVLTDAVIDVEIKGPKG